MRIFTASLLFAACLQGQTLGPPVDTADHKGLARGLAESGTIARGRDASHKAALLDKGIRSGKLPAMILAMPNSGKTSYYSTFVVESLFFLARYFPVVSFGTLSMRVGRHFQKVRTPESFLVPAPRGQRCIAS